MTPVSAEHGLPTDVLAMAEVGAAPPYVRFVDPRWREGLTGLEVLDRVGGGLFDAEGVVEFRAHHREGGRSGVQHERSRFRRDAGRWVYLDGVVGDPR